MKNSITHFLVFAILGLTNTICFSQTYTLTVTGGYGSGSYSAGDTVDIWCGTIASNQVFDKWSGNISTLESADEWHTKMVMPAQNATITANFKTIGNVIINHESIMGRDTLKEVYSYFPTGFKGVIFCFHGTGGAASNWTTLFEYKQFLNDAVADTFGFIITEAEEITKQADFDGDGKLRWAVLPYDSVANTDLANIRILIDTFQKRGVIDPATKFYGVGMSNGGAFAPIISTMYNWKAAVSYCAQSSQLLVSNTNVPIQWCMAKYDNHPQVGSQGNADALADHNTLEGRGICTKYFLFDHSPVYPERFMRSGTINSTKATSLFNEFISNNLLDANHYLLYASDTIALRIAASPLSYPTFLTLPTADKVFVATQVDAMYAAHQFFSDFNKQTLGFFDSLCDTVSQPTDVLEDYEEETQVNVFPNPTQEDLMVNVSRELIGEKASLFDILGNEIDGFILNGRVVKRSLNNIPSGVYLLRIKNHLTKVVKN